MIKSENKLSYKVKIYFNGNNKLERITPYGMIFMFLLLIFLVFQNSFYFYIKEEIRYIYWTMLFMLLASLISCFCIWKFKLKLKDISFDFPKEIRVGEFFFIKNKSLNINKIKSDIYVRYKVKTDPNVNDDDLKNMKLLYNSDHEKWGNVWSYGGKLGYNSYDVLPLDVEQLSLNSEKIAIFGKRRGRVEILGYYLYSIDIFGFFRVRRFVKFNSPIIINILPEISKNKDSKLKDISKAVSDKGFLTNSNIIGIRKGRKNDSMKNTHWKIFAKKEEQWVFLKEKEDKKPSLLWVDTNMKDPKIQSEQFETMLSDVFSIIESKKIDGIIIGNEYFLINKSMSKIKEKIVKIKVSGDNVDNFEELIKIENFNLIIGLSVNKEKDNPLLDKLKVELNKKNKKIRTIVYE